MFSNKMMFPCLLAGGCFLGVVEVDAQFAWADLIPVQTDGATDNNSEQYSAIAPGQTSDVWSVWWRGPITYTYGGTIFRTRTTDGGSTWAPPTVVATNETNGIQLASDQNGTMIAVWHAYPSDADIYFSRSTDDGATWSAPSRLHPSMTSDRPYDYFPHLATDRSGTWVVVFERHYSSGHDYDVAYCRSTDNGVTWSSPVFIDPVMTSDSSNTADHTPIVATDTKGNWVISWQSNTPFLGSTISTDYYHLVFSRSTDGGATWSPMSLIDASDLFDAPESLGSVNGWMAADSTGNFNVVIASDENIASSGTDRDIFCAHSPDAGATWSPLVLVNDFGKRDTVIDNAPTIACSDDGSLWVAGWISLFQPPSGITDSNMWFSKSDDGGATWQTVGIVNTNHATDVGYDNYPELAYGHGKWAATMCAEKFTGNDYDIVFTTGIADGDVDETSIDFGSVPGHSTSISVRDIVLTNNGLDVMSITSIAITGSDSVVFDFAFSPDTSDLGIGEKRKIFLSFVPNTTNGTKSATLEIATSDPNNPTFSISLSGTAITPLSTDGWFLR